MLEGVCSTTTLKFVGLAVGFAAKFSTGSVFIFNAYQDAIKNTFNYTQLEGKALLIYYIPFPILFEFSPNWQTHTHAHIVTHTYAYMYRDQYSAFWFYDKEMFKLC